MSKDLEEKILKTWQFFKELSDKQMECDHDFWETPNHWGGKCQLCGVREDETVGSNEFAYFHDGYQFGHVSAIAERIKVEK